MTRVLVLNCYSRNALAAAAGLRGHATVFGATAHQGGPTWLADRWLHSPDYVEIFRYPNPVADPARFLDALVKLVLDNRIDAVIPAGTAITDQLSSLKQPVEGATNAKVLVEDFTTLQRVTDKWGIVELCRELEIPVPPTRRYASPDELRTAAAELGLPLVVKPCSSSAAKGLAFLDDDAALERYLAESAAAELKAHGSFVAQALVAGSLHDVTACAKAGEPLGLLSQERLVTLYDFGGGGLINRTTDEPDLREAAAKILRATRWDGIIEFDFVRRADGSFVLLECNPKIWGTTQLTIDAGLNYPRMLVDAFVHGRDVAPVTGYEVGLVYKWVFPELFPYAWTRRPRRPAAVLRRVWATLKPYPGTRTRWNLRWGNLRALLGQALVEFVFPDA